MWPILSLAETLHLQCQPAEISDLQPAGYRPMRMVRPTDPLPEMTHRSKRCGPGLSGRICWKMSLFS